MLRVYYTHTIGNIQDADFRTKKSRLHTKHTYIMYIILLCLAHIIRQHHVYAFQSQLNLKQFNIFFLYLKIIFKTY